MPNTQYSDDARADADEAAQTDSLENRGLTEDEMLERFFSDDEEDERRASEEEMDELISKAEEKDEPEEIPFRDTATPEELYQKSVEVLNSQANHRPIFYRTLELARETHPGTELASAIGDLDEMKLISYPCGYFISELYDAGALDRELPEDYVPRRAERLDAEAFLTEEEDAGQTEVAVQDEDVEPAADETPDTSSGEGEPQEEPQDESQEEQFAEPRLLDYDYFPSEVGQKVLSDFSADKRLASLFDVEEELVPGFKAVLTYCDEAPRTLKEVEKMLTDNGYHVGLDLDASFYLDSLERSGGLTWSDGWKTTEEGRELTKEKI
ncbi:MAG: hypothetical protein ACOX69_09990 [Coriobacteriales bacterium]|jgi:hypothetical protein